MSPPLITDVSVIESRASGKTPFIVFYYNKPTPNAKFCNSEKAKEFIALAESSTIFSGVWINKAYGEKSEYKTKKRLLKDAYRVSDDMGILIFRDGKIVERVKAIDSKQDRKLKLTQFKKILNECKESKSSGSPKQEPEVPKPAPKKAKTPSVKEGKAKKDKAPSVKSAKAQSVNKPGTPTKDDAPVDCCTIL